MKYIDKKKLYLGIFVIISTIILIVSLYLIGSKKNLFGKNFKISAVFTNVNGLQLGNNVRYSGINVGTVKKITLINDTTICVDMVIEENMLHYLKKNAIATIKTDGLVGSMTISIVPSLEPSTPIMPGDTLMSLKKSSTDEMLNTLGTTNDNVAKLVIDLLKITKAINEGEGTISVLLNDTIMAKNLKQTVANLQTASIEVNTTIDEVKSIIESINYDESLAATLLSDTSTANQVKSILSNLDKSSKDINDILTNANELILDIKNGEGPLDYIINDTSFVNNIDKIMKNLQEGSGILNEELEALKHNIIFRRYFKKLEKEKNSN